MISYKIQVCFQNICQRPAKRSYVLGLILVVTKLHKKIKDKKNVAKLLLANCCIEFCPPVFGCCFINSGLSQFGVAGHCIEFPKDRGFALANYRDFGQPKDEFNTTFGLWLVRD